MHREGSSENWTQICQLCSWHFEDSVSCKPGCFWTSFVAEVGLVFLLPPLSKCWDYWCVLTYPEEFIFVTYRAFTMCHMEHSPYRSYQLQNTRFKRTMVTRTVFSELKEKLEISSFSWTIGLSQAWGDVYFFPINCLYNSLLRCAHRSCQLHDMTRYVCVRVGQLQKSQTSQTVHVVEKLQNPFGTKTETKLVYTGM